MSLQNIADNSTFTVKHPDGTPFVLLRLSAQVAGEAIGTGVLAFGALQNQIKSESFDPEKFQHELSKVAKAYLRAAMVSPRLADDDLAVNAEANEIGWKRLGNFGLELFTALMESNGEGSSFSTSPQDSGGQS